MQSLIKRIKDFIQFIKDARVELGRVTWPSRREVMVTTLAVVVFSFMIALLLGLFDYVYSWLIGYFL